MLFFALHISIPSRRSVENFGFGREIFTLAKVRYSYSHFSSFSWSRFTFFVFRAAHFISRALFEFWAKNEKIIARKIFSPNCRQKTCQGWFLSFFHFNQIDLCWLSCSLWMTQKSGWIEIESSLFGTFFITYDSLNILK